MNRLVPVYSENMLARDHLDDPGVRRENTIKMDLKEIGSREFHHPSDLSLSKKNWSMELDNRKNCALLGYYAASCGNFSDVSGQPICPIFTGQESKRTQAS